MSKVNVYEDDKIIARVAYNNDLDIWDGNNFCNGGVGQHLGIAQIKDGRYVLIYGTQWQGCRDSAEIVSDEDALQAILEAEADYMLDGKGFERLKELAIATDLL